MPQNKPNVFLITLASIFFVYILFLLFQFTNTTIGPAQVACTLEAKICPDGSAVGRAGPKCEFTQCPVVPTISSSTYVNPTYNYSFDFNQNWIVDTQDLSNIIVSNINSPNQELPSISINVITKSLNTVLEDYKATPQETIIGGQKATKITYTTEMGHDMSLIYVKHNNLILLIQYPEFSDTQLKPQVDQIISTFKFASSTETFCGGIAGKLCPSGYNCKYDGDYPDASGTCVK